MNWLKIEIVDSGRKMNILVNPNAIDTIRPTPHGHTALEINGKTIVSTHPLDFFENLPSNDIRSQIRGPEDLPSYALAAIHDQFIAKKDPGEGQEDPDLKKVVKTEGPKVISKTELERKLGKQPAKKEPKVKPVATPSVGTTSAALDSTPEVVPN